MKEQVVAVYAFDELDAKTQQKLMEEAKNEAEADYEFDTIHQLKSLIGEHVLCTLHLHLWCKCCLIHHCKKVGVFIGV